MCIRDSQNTDLAVTLPSASSQCSNFCASAKNNSSPNTFSIDGKALISSGGTCSGAGGASTTVQTEYETAVKLAENKSCNRNEATQQMYRDRQYDPSNPCHKLQIGSAAPLNGVYTQELTPQQQELYNRILNPNCEYPCTADGNPPMNDRDYMIKIGWKHCASGNEPWC